MNPRQTGSFGVAIALVGLLVGTTCAMTTGADTGWCTAALQKAQAALAEAERSHGTNSYLVVKDLMTFADACAVAEDYDAARIAYSRAAELQKQQLKDINQDLVDRLRTRIDAFNRLGQVCLKLRQFEMAEAAFNQAIANAQLVFLPTNEEVKVARNGYALARSYRMQFDKAEQFLSQLLDACESALGAEHEEVARVLAAQVELYKTVGKLSAAETPAHKLVELRRKIDPDSPVTAEALNMLASILYERKRYEQALPLVQEALAIRQKAYGQEHPKTAISMANIASLYDEMGNAEKAAEYRAAAEKITEQQPE